MKLRIATFVLLIALAIGSCKDGDEPVGFQLTPVNLLIPAHFPLMDIPEWNTPSLERIELGRRLYYDERLARGMGLEGMSCSGCHQQETSFSSGQRTAVLPHLNLGWATFFLWNGAKEGTLEDVMEFELRDFFEADLDVLKGDPGYVSGFANAFEDGGVNYGNAAQALAQFVRSMISANSKFDKFLQGELELSAEEQRGYEIFNSERGDCFHCHALPLMTDNSFHNIGLVDKFKDHLGRYTVTGRTADVGAFKTPTLRNVEVTAPYMHDDRFATLEEVIEHYNTGVLQSPTLDPIMTKAGKETGLHLSETDKGDLIAFLKTLTDTTFLTRKALQKP